MKKVTIALAVIFAFTITNINAQQRDWRDGSNEINLGLKPFALGVADIQYKTKISQKNWMRISLTDLNVRDGETGIRLGIEKQKNMALRTRFIYGLEAGTHFNYDRIDNSVASYEVDLGIPIGIQFHLTKRLLFGLEGRPSLGIMESYIPDDGFERETNIGTGIDLFNGIRGSIGYRF